MKGKMDEESRKALIEYKLHFLVNDLFPQAEMFVDALKALIRTE